MFAYENGQQKSPDVLRAFCRSVLFAAFPLGLFKEALFDSLVCHDDGLDCAVFVEVHSVYACLAVVAAVIFRGAAVVAYVPVVGSGVVEHRVVSRAFRAYFIAGGQHKVYHLEGAERRIGDCVGHPVVVGRPAAFRPHKVPFAFAFEHDGAFGVVFGGYVLGYVAVGEGHDGFEVVGEAHDVAAAPASVDHQVVVFVFENKLVYGLRVVEKFGKKRLAQQVFVGAFGLVGHGHAYAAVFGVVGRFGR